LRILFAGTPANAAETLDALVSNGVNVVGVLTRNDARLGRSAAIAQSPVAIRGQAHEIPVFKSNSIDQETMQWMDSLAPDLGVIVAYGSILKSDALAIPKQGWINLHYSLLPKFRGASPVQQAILEGEKVTGVTIFELDQGIDSGAILAAVSVPVPDEADAGSLLELLTVAGAGLLTETLADFANLKANKIVQADSGESELTKKISREDARINFTLPAEQLHNLVRAMNPEPMAWFEIDKAPVRVLASSVVDVDGSTEAVAKLIGPDLVVGCGQSSLILKIVQPSGKKPMTGADWFRGLRRESLLLS
jgi:methionyl-tRNA formyltransferase